MGCELSYKDHQAFWNIDSKPDKPVKKDADPLLHTHGSVEGYKASETHSHEGGDEPHDHDHGSYVGPGANWRAGR